MMTLIQCMKEQQLRFEKHPFFARLPEESLERVIPVVARHLTFWIMAFQDLLPLVEDAVRSPQWKSLAAHHRKEDAGHNLWFFKDLEKIGVRTHADVIELFRPATRLARLTTYALFSEFHRLTDDRLRIAYLMSLESSGHVFFGKMSEHMDRLGLGDTLLYFAHHHIGVEKAHTVFTDQADALLREVLPSDLREQGLQMVIRTHETFHRLFDEMTRELEVTPRPETRERRAAVR